MDYFVYISDVHLTNKFFYLCMPTRLSKFRLTRFSVSFYSDNRMHHSVFYGTRVLIDQVLCKRFRLTKMHRYVLSSSIRFNQVVGASSGVSGAQALVAAYVFLQYSLIRISYGLVFIGPERINGLSSYVFKTGFNRIVFLFNLGMDAKPVLSFCDTYFYGFDIFFEFVTGSVYTNKVILSHYGYPML